MTDNRKVAELLKQGIDAAKAHDNARARNLLEQVVQLDQHNEKGWFWLAAVTDNLDEKRICLGNVLVINPNNVRARDLLDKLEAQVDVGDIATFAAQPARTGTRRIGLLSALLALLIVLLAAAAFLLLSEYGDNEAQSPQTGAAPSSSQSPGPSAIAGGAQSATPLPSPTPMPSATPSPPPPTWTPQPSSTPQPVIPATLYPPPPTSIPGKIIMQSGQVPGDRENQPIVLSKADGTGQRTLTSETRGRVPVLSPDGLQYAFVEYIPGTREVMLKLNNIQGTAPRPVSSFWGNVPTLFRVETPAWSPDGGWLAFIAFSSTSATPDLYRVRLGTTNDPSALERLTSDDVIEGWPAFSPDGTQIVYVADRSKLDFDTPVDLAIYNLMTGTITALTTNGVELIESAPDWSPNGQYIVFEGRAAGSTNSDIYRVPASGFGQPEKIIASDANDIRPRYSPDGNYLMFTSDRSGNWDVFMLNLLTQELYQFTSSPDPDIANDWSR